MEKAPPKSRAANGLFFKVHFHRDELQKKIYFLKIVLVTLGFFIYILLIL